MTLEEIRFPIGIYKFNGMNEQQKMQWIAELEQLSGLLDSAVCWMNDKQLDTPYRDGGWTVRQTVHHMADAAMNGFTRFKLALTEDTPVIKPFEQVGWAATADSISMPIEPSLLIIDGILKRWTNLLRAMQPTDYLRHFMHPELGKTIKLNYFLGASAWHMHHHYMQIVRLTEHRQWSIET